MSRAEEILEHPLAGRTSSITLRLKSEPTSGQVVGADFGPNPEDKNSWGHLATMLRPLMFLTTDEGNMGQLINQIKREHVPLRQSSLQDLQDAINAWRKQPIIAVQEFGPFDGDEEPEPEYGNVSAMWTGPVGAKPVGFDNLIPDYELADVYFYGRMWHADADKVDQYDGASPGMRALMAKCAEVRTLSAVQWVRNLSELITDARKAGWPL